LVDVGGLAQMTDTPKGAPAAAPPSEPEEELASDSLAVEDRPPPARAPRRTVVPRWVQLVALPLALLALWALAKAAGKVLLLFIVAALIALILNPAVAFVQRLRVPRGLAVLAVYLAFFLALVGVGFLLAKPISNQARVFIRNAPHYVDEANRTLGEAQRELNSIGFHVKLIKPGETAVQTIKEKLDKSAGKIASFGGALLTEAAGAVFNLVLVFVLSVYMLIYGPRIGALARRAMPDGDGSAADDYPTLVQRAVSRYVGGQLLFSLVMGTTAGVALYLFGVLGIFPPGKTYAVVFGAFLAVMELIPYIGPILGALPPIIVALLTKPISAVWVALLFIGLQQLEGHVVAPQIFGHTLRINPLLVIFALLVGFQIYGILGALIALPIVAVVRETIVYLHRHLEFESWERSRGGIL
jgi:predicted PurR-regulated permease PerM